MSGGRHYRFEKYEFWAERGMISLVDTEMAGDSSNDRTSHWRIAPGEFMKRAVAAMIAEPDKYPSKLKQLRDLLDNAKTACLLAKKQGDPSDPRVIDHVVKHQRKSSLLLPGQGLPPMPGQRMKIRPTGDVSDILSQGVQVVPDLVIDPSTVITPGRQQMAIGG